MRVSIDFDEDEDISESKLHKDLEDLLRNFIIQYVKTRPIDIIKFSEKYFKDLNHSNEVNKDSASFDRSRSQISSGMYALTPRMSVRRSLHKFAAISDKYLQSSKESEITFVPNENCPLSYTEYKELLETVYIFNTLNEEEIRKVLNNIEKREIYPGEIIINQGDEGDYFYIISKGIYEVYIKEGKEPVNVKSYHGQGYFGEIALMYNCLRTSTVVSRTNGVLFCLTSDKFKEIVVEKAFEKRKICFKILQKVDLFKGFNDYELNYVADLVGRRTYHSNECIINQGEEANEMFIIESGEVLITRKVNNANKELFRLRSTEYFGEISLIMNSTRKVTAYTMTDVEVMVISKTAFFLLFSHCMESLKENLSKYIYYNFISSD